MSINQDVISQRIGYRFDDAELLRRALTHRSYASVHNERLEFLGDSVVNCIVALELHDWFPDLAEGALSRLRAGLVNQDALHRIALTMDLGPSLLLGEGELKSGGSRRPSILADAVEAIIGAVLLDGGFVAAQAVVNTLFGSAFERIDPQHANKDPKTLLQEYAQGKSLPLPGYTLLATGGRAHAQTFLVECVLEKLDIRTEGVGASRRAAEQDAARKAYARLPR